MKDINCPSCGKTFRIDPSSFEEILLQIKDEEFNKQIEERLKLAEEDNYLLHELPHDSFKSIEKKINNNVFKVLSVENSVKSKISYGGTSPKEVLKQIKNAKRRFLK